MIRSLTSAYGAGYRAGRVGSKYSPITHIVTHPANPCKGLRGMAWELGFYEGWQDREAKVAA